MKPSPGAASRAKRRWVLLASRLLSPLVVELVVRLSLGPPEYLAFMPADPELGWILRPGLERSDLDDQGLYPVRINAKPAAGGRPLRGAAAFGVAFRSRAAQLA